MDFTQLAESLDFTSSSLRERVFNIGWKQIWAEAKRLAHQRAYDSGAFERARTLTPPESMVTDDDLVQAAKNVLL